MLDLQCLYNVVAITLRPILDDHGPNTLVLGASYNWVPNHDATNRNKINGVGFENVIGFVGVFAITYACSSVATGVGVVGPSISLGATFAAITTSSSLPINSVQSLSTVSPQICKWSRLEVKSPKL